MNVLDRHVLVGPVATHQAGRLRRQTEQRSNGSARLAARAQLEQLSELYQHDDHRRGLEVHRHAAIGHAERVWEETGHQRGHDREEIGHADAERDQREHVEAAVDERLPAAGEERRPAPQYDRRRQHQLRPRAHGRRNGVTEVFGEQLAHREQRDRHGQRDADAEAARHVLELFVRRLLGGDHDRLEGHAADRARPGADLTHLGVHRAGVFDLAARI
jgi:hypothetical protein